jgi:UDP-GlcNAc:undecaprenyl-phosphate GlcNAc-1-phosphate transferase
VGRLARTCGLTDRPDGQRKLHQRPVALGGGVAVFVSFLAALVIAAWVNDSAGMLWNKPGQLPALLSASLLLVLLGLIDDRYGLRGRHKLLGQIAAAAILCFGGIVVRRVSLFDHTLDLGLLSVPFTVFWLVGATNALNLIDGIDGLASTVGIILSVSLAAMAMFVGHHAEAFFAVALAGSLMGFLVYNFPRARIYLGDAGSMLVGLLVGALAIQSTLKGPATVALAAPAAVWAIPVFDSLMAIVRRKLTGRSIYCTDRAHLHHRLLTIFGTNTRVVGVVALCCAATCGGALASVYTHGDIAAVGSVAAVVGILVATRAFGHVELQLLGNRARSIGWSFLQPWTNPERAPRQSAIRLQGSRHWDRHWESMIEFADKLRLHRVRLDVNSPAVHEGFHACWERGAAHDARALWSTEIPLFAGDHVVGRLTVTGEREGASSCDLIERLMDLLQPIEARLTQLAGADYQPPPAVRPVPAAAAYSGELVAAER